jgi:hypothetical protein
VTAAAAHDPSPGYTLELDTWLQRPAVRITRALKQGAWSTHADLFGALELGTDELSLYASELEELVAGGRVLFSADAGVVRYQLVRALDPPAPPEPAPGAGCPKRTAYFDGERCGDWFSWRGRWRPW